MSKKKHNWNTLAKEVSHLEGKKTNLNIGEIKEVLKCLRIILIANPKYLVMIINDWFKQRRKIFEDGEILPQ